MKRPWNEFRFCALCVSGGGGGGGGRSVWGTRLDRGVAYI